MGDCLIPDGSRILLVDEKGTKHFVVAERRMIEVRGLGAVDGTALCMSDLGDRISIAGRHFDVVKPSIADLLASLERKAQTISAKDSFQIPMYMDLGCGSRVAEAGAGSGALTLVLLKAVAPEGAVYTYEVREDHAKVAERNVRRSEHAPCWHLRIGDVCAGIQEKDLDGVVLDIPNPWDAMGAASSALRAGGHVCCYVPNANQLEEAVKKMRALGLREVFAFETLHREMTVHERGVRPSSDMIGHTGYLAFGRKIRA
ncbi:TPA: tRNA (adenine-N1)-methyltransferase [Thermoplasmata archaeon]|nr:tRNA (adenine-N1)-methyltransferase [Thermoplasmata archaeon]